MDFNHTWSHFTYEYDRNIHVWVWHEWEVWFKLWFHPHWKTMGKYIKYRMHLRIMVRPHYKVEYIIYIYTKKINVEQLQTRTDARIVGIFHFLSHHHLGNIYLHSKNVQVLCELTPLQWLCLTSVLINVSDQGIP